MTDISTLEDDTPAAPEYLGDMMVVTRCASINEALTLKGCLVAAGIPATIGDQNLMMQGGGWLGGSLEGVRVLAPETLVTRAAEIVAEYRGGAFEIEGDPDPDLPPATTPTTLALWSPDLAAWLSTLLTPVFGATLHWMNSRTLGEPRPKRAADAWLLLSVVATGAGFWILREREWSLAKPFQVSGFITFYTVAWYLFGAHAQSRFIIRSFGRRYRHRNVWLAAAIVFGVMLALGFAGEALGAD